MLLIVTNWCRNCSISYKKLTYQKTYQKTETTRKEEVITNVTNAFFVDGNNGNDDWSGNFVTPSHNDGPLRTIKAAVNAIRKYRRRNSVGKITVYLRKGVYRLKETIVLRNKVGNE